MNSSRVQVPVFGEEIQVNALLPHKKWDSEACRENMFTTFGCTFFFLSFKKPIHKHVKQGIWTYCNDIVRSK